MIILDGKTVSNELKKELANRVVLFQKQFMRSPCLKVIIVGNDLASQVYVKNKHLACEKIGMKSEIIRLDQNVSEVDLVSQIKKLNSDELVDGILVQLPIPPHLSQSKILEAISPLKDVDGLTYTSTGYLWSGNPLATPCTPSGVIKILKHYQIPIKGKKALVIGRSQIVGKPMAALLLQENATVTIAHSQSEDISDLIKQNEIIVVAAGKAGLFGEGDFNPNAVVIDVGMHGTGSGKLCGDVRFGELQNKVRAITPVPGGVGPMTIACLLENTIILAEKRLGKNQ